MANSHNDIKKSRNTLAKQLPNSIVFKAKLTTDELKSRLERGDLALTIVDIRAPKAFNREHIKGAISVPFARIEDLGRSALPHYREIYIYGESDEQSLHGVQTLLSTGFKNVAQIIGGLATWREIAGATEGIGIYHQN